MLKDLEHGEDNVRSFEPKRLWAKQKEILRLYATGLYNRQEIANVLNITPQTVTNIIRSEHGRAVLEMMEGASDNEAVQLLTRIKALAPIALSVQEEIMLDDNTQPRLKKDIADKMLDRAGFAPVAKSVNFSVSAGLTAEDLEKIKNRAREIEAIDAEVVNDG